MCHEKTNLKVFVVVIPMEGLAGWSPANPSLGMTQTVKYYYCLHRLYPVVVVVISSFVRKTVCPSQGGDDSPCTVAITISLQSDGRTVPLNDG